MFLAGGRVPASVAGRYRLSMLEDGVNNSKREISPDWGSPD